jgi:DNA-binding NtrC family response regulator
LRRIAGVRVQVPVLRERREDIELLARELCGELHRDRRLPAAWIDRDALSVLESYTWPGNVPELKHVLEQALVEAQGSVIRREPLEHALRVQRGAASTPAAQAQACSVKDRIKRAWQDNLRGPVSAIRRQHLEDRQRRRTRPTYGAKNAPRDGRASRAQGASRRRRVTEKGEL